MDKKKAYTIILAGLILAIAIPLTLRYVSVKNRTLTIPLKARKYGYSPSRIVVNKGDTVLLKPTSLDVTHGFLLDGYPVEFKIKQEGINYLKYTWEDDDKKIHTDWDKVHEVEFTADKPGKFTYRCTQTCGNLHPFMTGELIVRPNTPYLLYVSLSIWLTGSLLLLFLVRPDYASSGFKRVDLLSRWRWLRGLVGMRTFHFMVIFPNLVIFYLFILSAFWGSPVGNRNIAIIFVWIVWWFVLKAILVPLGGRLWCMVCPLPAPSEWLSRKALTAVHYVKKPFKGLHHRFTGLQKDWPKVLDNMWLQNGLFLALISFAIILITRPIATAVLFLAILGVSLVLSLVYRRRIFCHYLCPVGGFLGSYSMASMTELRVVDPAICKKHKDKECLLGGQGGWACPWGQYPGKMARNNYCGLCTECIKSCPKKNVSIFFRPFGSDRRFRDYDEMFNVIIMMVVAIAFSITMLGRWGFIKEAANVTETRQIIPFLTYLAVLWSGCLVVFPGLFALATKGAHRLLGKASRKGKAVDREPAEGKVTYKELMLRSAYMLVPLGIFFWIAFSLPSVMVNYGYILAVFSDPFGLGWDLFGTAGYHFSPFLPEWIPVILGIILLGGLYFALTRGNLALRNVIPEPALRVRALIFPALFVLLAVNIMLKLFVG